MFSAAIGASEERVLSIERNRSDAALDDIGINLDAAIVDEAREALPARERIVDCFGELSSSG